MVVLKCPISKQAVGLAILKKNSEVNVGPGPMSLDLLGTFSQFFALKNGPDVLIL